MNETKIRLSPKEAELIVNADWILTKNEIIIKVKLLLSGLMNEQSEFLETIKHQLPNEVLTLPPKIARGENYKGLPYLVLDHPRFFDKENVFAVRTMFWWGNFFSVTLHLAGYYKEKYEQAIMSAYQLLKEQGCYFCINESPWEYHFEESNYSLAGDNNEETFKKNIVEKNFIKLTKKMPLQCWDEATVQLLNNFRFFTGIINARY